MDLQEVGWGRHRLDECGSEQGQVVGSCERGNEPSGSIKCVEIDYLRISSLLKKDSAPWSSLLSWLVRRSKQSWHNLSQSYYPRICLERMEKSMKDLKDTRYPGRCMNLD